MIEAGAYQWYPGTEPERYNSLDSFIGANSALLQAMSTRVDENHRELNKVIWVYDLLHAEWFTDLPIVLKIDEDYFAVCNYGLGGLSLGVNNIDLTRRWDYLPGYFDQPWLLEWRVFNTGMRLPQTIMKCEPISDAPIDPIAIMGIALKFADFTLEVVNGLDTNQIVIRDADGKTAFSTPTDIEPGVGWSSGCF